MQTPARAPTASPMATTSDPALLLSFLLATLPLWATMLTGAGWLIGSQFAIPTAHTGALLGTFLGLVLTGTITVTLIALRYHHHLHTRPLHDQPSTPQGPTRH